MPRLGNGDHLDPEDVWDVNDSGGLEDLAIRMVQDMDLVQDDVATNEAEDVPLPGQAFAVEMEEQGVGQGGATDHLADLAGSTDAEDATDRMVWEPVAEAGALTADDDPAHIYLGEIGRVRLLTPQEDRNWCASEGHPGPPHGGHGPSS